MTVASEPIVNNHDEDAQQQRVSSATTMESDFMTPPIRNRKHAADDSDSTMIFSKTITEDNDNDNNNDEDFADLTLAPPALRSGLSSFMEQNEEDYQKEQQESTTTMENSAFTEEGPESKENVEERGAVRRRRGFAEEDAALLLDESSPVQTDSEDLDGHRPRTSSSASLGTSISAIEETTNTSLPPSPPPCIKVVSWSETLQTPATCAAFSPSRGGDVSSAVATPTPTKDSVPTTSSSCSGTNRSLHGLGLQLAVDRARLLHKAGRRSVLMLLDVTSLYEQYAQALLRASQALQQNPLLLAAITASTAPDTKQSPVMMISGAFLVDSVAAWSGEVTKLAGTLRTLVALSLQNFMGTHGEVVSNLWNRYLQSRQNCVTSRLRALVARGKYIKALRETEQCILEWKSKLSDEEKKVPELASSDNNPAAIAEGGAATEGLTKMPKRVASKVKDWQRYKVSYQNAVVAENDCVDICQRLEIMCLESMQTLEEDRVLMVATRLIQTLQAEKQAVEDAVVALPSSSSFSSLSKQPQEVVMDDAEDNSWACASSESINSDGGGTSSSAGGAISTDKKRAGTKAFVKLLKSSGNVLLPQPPPADTDCSGVMDADTLGLPEEMGKLRDNVKARTAARTARVQATRTLAAFLEQVAAASAKLGVGLKQYLTTGSRNGAAAAAVATNNLSGSAYRGMPGQSQLLNDALAACEGPRVYKLWEGVLKILELESEGSLAFASSLRRVRSDKLDSVFYIEKTIKQAAEMDDGLWKQLCEAARAQSKAELRYRQTTAQAAKARERVKSVDSVENKSGAKATTSESKNSNPMKLANKHMSKTFANMFAILPDGGEQAMKMLAPSARASIAQRTLEEAGQKETKGRVALDSAVEEAFRALQEYKLAAEALVNQYEEDDKTGWDDVRDSILAFADQMESLRVSRQNALQSMDSMMSSTLNTVAQDVNEWRDAAEQQLKSLQHPSEQAEDSVTPESGFMLTFCLESSNIIMETLGLGCEGDVTEESSAINEDDGDVEYIVDGSNPAEEVASSTARGSSTEAGMTMAPSESEPAASTDDKQSQRRPRRSFVGNTVGMGFQSPASFRPNFKLLKKKGKNLRVSSNQIDCELEIFLAYFWQDNIETKHAPTIVAAFQCSFRGDSQSWPTQYGRLYLTTKRLIFVSWTGKKILLKWHEVIETNPVQDMVSTKDDLLRVTCKRDGSEGSYVVLGGFVDRDATMDKIREVKEEEEAAKPAVVLEAEPGTATSISVPGTSDLPTQISHIPDQAEQQLPPVPPDGTLQNMHVVLAKHLYNTSIQRFYEIVWSEGNGTNEKPLYRPWLERVCFDIEIGDWDFTDAVGPWDGERYIQKRLIKFKVKRRTHLYIGPPIANVTQRHFCRVEGQDKCVLSMTIEFDGIPYSDTFAVEVRWVARRVGVKDILVEVGLHVDFKKNTFLKSKIRSGTIEETTPVHRSLFEVAKTACIAAEGGQVAVAQQEAEVLKSEGFLGETLEKRADVAVTEGILRQYLPKELACRISNHWNVDHFATAVCGGLLLLVWWLFLSSKATPPSPLLLSSSMSKVEIEFLGQRLDDLEAEMKNIQHTLKDILSLLQNFRAEG